MTGRVLLLFAVNTAIRIAYRTFPPVMSPAPDLSLLDGFAFAWFLACWFGYVWFADYSRWRRRSASALIDVRRCQWMRNMMQRRETRMMDALIHSSLVGGVAFFASTSLLLVGGLLAILGAADEAIAVMAQLPFGTQVSRTLWQGKVLMMVVIFVYAFFKFAWCYRLYNYCAILIGAMPHTDEEQPPDAEADRIGQLYSLAGRQFNNGLRAYFFALAALGWFLHPGLFMLVTMWVVSVLYRREFRSRSFKILSE